MNITSSTVGTCTAEAVVCVEGYSPRDGRAHGDLDVAVYVCEAHHETARTEWLAGLTPYTIKRAVGRRCGQVTAFAEVPGLPLEGETVRQEADEPAAAEPVEPAAAGLGATVLQEAAEPARRPVRMCVRCCTITDEPVTVSEVHVNSGAGFNVYACPECAVHFPPLPDVLTLLTDSYRSEGGAR